MAKPSRSPRTSGKKAHEPPALGPRRKPVKPRPLKGQPSVGAEYDPGLPVPPDKSPWQDEGRPETNG
jgi:hypothetical protein